jgi:hypothetical protein
MATIEKMVMATSDDQVLNLEKKNEKKLYGLKEKV